MPTPAHNVHHLVEHLFRHKAGQVLATLTRIFGVEHLDLAEDVTQEALLRALRHWPYRGVPQNPGGWILQCARNLALDALRRETSFRGKSEEIARQLEQDLSTEEPRDAETLQNDQLRMMFVCCHPELAQEAQVALILKTLCGFSVEEIARAFLTTETTLAQRLVRAKRKLRDLKVACDLPETEALHARLDSVLAALYLLFNEGYNAHLGEDLIRAELCAEAMRLCRILAEHGSGNKPQVHALLALLLLQASRLPARTDDDGHVLVLAQQDRRRWDQNLIQRGLYHLQCAAQGEDVTEYHVLAGIASCHATAPHYEATNWPNILRYYDMLMTMNHSPVIALNRAVALSKVKGPEAGIAALEKIRHLPPMKSYYLMPATLAEFHLRLGNRKQAEACYQQALALTGTEPERKFLMKKIAACHA